MKDFDVPFKAILKSSELKEGGSVWMLHYTPKVVSDEMILTNVGFNESLLNNATCYMFIYSDSPHDKLHREYRSSNIDGLNSYNDDYLFHSKEDAIKACISMSEQV